MYLKYLVLILFLYNLEINIVSPLATCVNYTGFSFEGDKDNGCKYRIKDQK